MPRIVVRGDAGGALDGGGDDLARCGEGDVRAHPVAPLARRAEPMCQPVRQPAFDAARGDRATVLPPSLRRPVGWLLGPPPQP